MKRHLHTQKEQAQTAHTEETQVQRREFSTPEEMLRHDALHTPVPPTLACRLEESIGQLPPAPDRSGPWWRKLFNRDK